MNGRANGSPINHPPQKGRRFSPSIIGAGGQPDKRSSCMQLSPVNQAQRGEGLMLMRTAPIEFCLGRFGWPIQSQSQLILIRISPTQSGRETKIESPSAGQNSKRLAGSPVGLSAGLVGRSRPFVSCSLARSLGMSIEADSLVVEVASASASALVSLPLPDPAGRLRAFEAERLVYCPGELRLHFGRAFSSGQVRLLSVRQLAWLFSLSLSPSAGRHLLARPPARQQLYLGAEQRTAAGQPI